MTHSVRQNAALRKGRNNLFERSPFSGVLSDREGSRPKANKFVVKALREKYRKERRREMIYWIASVLIGLTVLGLGWYYLGSPTL